MSPSELVEYVAVMRQHGVTEFAHGGLSIKLGQAPLGPRAEVPAPVRFSHEQLLFAATEGLPDDPSAE